MRFSIVIPVYNVKPYLCECLDSILAQTNADWEAIFVDDGSVDGSGEVLDSYARRDARIRVVHQKNGGVSRARNAALDVAVGEWIVFVDGDDALVPWALQTLDDAIESAGGIDLLRYSEQEVCHMNESLPLREGSVVPCAIDFRSVSGAREGYRRIGAGLLAWNCCYRRTVIRSLRFKPYQNGEDGLFAIEAFLRASKGARIPSTLYRYRIEREGSAIRQMTLVHVKSECEVLKIMCADISNWRYFSEILDELRRRMRLMVCGICALPPKLVSTERREAWANVLQMLKTVTRDYKMMCGSDLPRWRLAAWIGHPFAISMLVCVPFSVRVWLLKMPFVKTLKNILRKG